MEDYIKEVQEKYANWLNAADCPECDGSGGVCENEEDVHECYWCHVKKVFIATILTEARKKFLEEERAVLNRSRFKRIGVHAGAMNDNAIYNMALEFQISRLEAELKALDN